MRIEAIAIGKSPPEDVNVIIEVPVGGQPIKYEMDKEAGTLFVDRFLYTPMTYPGNYGFVPHTLSDDGDPDRCAGLQHARAGALPASSTCGRSASSSWRTTMAEDEKIIAVPSPHLTLRYADVHNYDDLPEITLKQIQHFFEHYKDLEPGKWVKIGDWGDAAEARRMIMAAIDRAGPKG